MLTLYFKNTCYYCHKVRLFATKNGIDLGLKDVQADQSAKGELIDLGGKTQVPFLVDAGRNISMYESDDIIEYLRTHYAHQG